MLKLDFFGHFRNGKDIQHFLVLLNMLEADGINDIRFARKAIQDYVDDAAKKTRKEMSPEQKASVKEEKRRKALMKRYSHKSMFPEVTSLECPECGSKSWTVGIDSQGVWYEGCRVCRFSKLIEFDETGFQIGIR